jgi:Ca2+-binding RTX toxin-like protein
MAGATLGLVASAVVAAGQASAAETASVANDTLTVDAGSGADHVALRLQAGAPNLLQVDLDDDGVADATFDRSTFSQIHVDLGSGADTFRVDQANGAFADEALTVDGGSGDDVMAGGDGREVFIGGSGSDSVDGNRGDDTGVMGSGSDTFRWDPGDGSDVVEGGSGNDTLDFNGAGVNEKMSLSANGGRSLFLRDIANIRMDMDDVERLDLTALGGSDTMVVGDMSGTDFRQADIDLSGPAGGGDGATDVVTVQGTARADRVQVATDGAAVTVEGLRTTTRITGSEPTDRLEVNGLAGDDTIDVGADVATRIQPVVDLGADG